MIKVYEDKIKDMKEDMKAHISEKKGL